MSQSNYIKIILNIKDENIFFGENACSERNIKGVYSKIFSASLTYTPTHCINCGCINENYSIIKNGSKKTLIKIPSVSGFNAYLDLKKQRFLCKCCNKTFSAETPIIASKSNISRATKVGIAIKLKEKLSEKYIAKEFNVSPNTVKRVVDDFYHDLKPNYSFLPEYLCFDEFKSTKNCDSAMSFIFCESKTGKIIDIVEDRKLNSLIEYFGRYSLEARKSVKGIVIDMYSPYMTLIENLFPSAKIILDRFHLVQLINKALNSNRIAIMNKFKSKEEPKYKKLKKYWKLILKDSLKLDQGERLYNKSFKRLMNENEILEYLISLDDELKLNYEIYQDLLYGITTKNFKLFKEKIDIYTRNKSVSPQMKTAIKTFKKYFNYIKNSLNIPYSNGILEGVNNKIKVIKRTSFGYSNFYHFRKRILICSDLLELKSA